MVSNEKLKWLEGQLPLWTERNIISAEQALVVRNQYPSVPANGALAQHVFSSVGAILIGLGVILFFAFNWSDMPHWSKLLVVFGGLLVSQFSGWWLYPSRRVLGESLHVLGTLMFGASIFLISQIYHIDDHYPNAFLLWGVAALAMGWFLPSLVQSLIAVFVLGLWLGMEVFEFRNVSWWAAPSVAAVFLPLAWKLSSRVLVVCSSMLLCFAIAATLAEYADEHGFIIGYLIAAFTVVIANRLAVARFTSGGRLLLLLSMGFHVAVLYVLGFDTFRADDVLRVRSDSTAELAVFVVLVVAFFAAILWRWRGSTVRIGAEWRVHLLLVSITVAGVAILGVGGTLDAQLAWLWVNVALVLHCVLWVLQGSREQRMALVSMACVVLIALAVPRFLDMFDSLLMRSLVFLCLGGGLFCIGNFYQAQKPEACS